MLLRNLEHAYKSKANLSRNWECTKRFDGSHINLSTIGIDVIDTLFEKEQET